MGHVVEIGFGEGDALEGVDGGEEDVVLAAAGVVEGDVAELVVGAVGLVGVGGEGFEGDVLAEDVVVARGGERGFLLCHVGEDLGDGGSGGRGVEGAEALLGLLGKERRGGEDQGEGEEGSGHGGACYRIAAVAGLRWAGAVARGAMPTLAAKCAAKMGHPDSWVGSA